MTDLVKVNTDQLASDIHEIVTESVFNSRWALVEGYWQVGQRLREEGEGITKLLQDLAVKTNLSQRTLWYCLQVFDKYPDLQSLPEGKNISWNKLITKYLPENSEIPEEPKAKSAKAEFEEYFEKCAASKSGSITIDYKGKKYKLVEVREKAPLSEKVPGLVVNDLIELFEPVNPSFEQLFKRTAERMAIVRLVEKHGEEWVRKLITVLPKIISQKYAPRVTTPCQLENKLGELQAFLTQQKGNDGQTIKIK